MTNLEIIREYIGKVEPTGRKLSELLPGLRVAYGNPLPASIRGRLFLRPVTGVDLLSVLAGIQGCIINCRNDEYVARLLTIAELITRPGRHYPEIRSAFKIGNVGFTRYLVANLEIPDRELSDYLLDLGDFGSL